MGAASSRDDPCTGGQRTQATSTDIATYDDFVNTVADASPLGIDAITWYALASTAAQSAAAQAALSGDTPIYHPLPLVTMTQLLPDFESDIHL